MASMKQSTKDDEKALAQVQVQTNIELLDEVRKANDKSRAQLERIAASTDHAGTTRAADAQRALDNDEKRFQIQQELTGRTVENTKSLREQNQAIDLQKENMEAQRKELEALGLTTNEIKDAFGIGS